MAYMSKVEIFGRGY